MKDKLQPKDAQAEFISLRKELIEQIGITYKKEVKGSKGVLIRVVSNEQDGGSQALLITNKGSWEGKVQMMGYSMGKKPDMNTLLREYADIKDKDYAAIFFSEEDDEAVSLKQERYIEENREKLLKGLNGEIEQRLLELRSY